MLCRPPSSSLGPPRPDSRSSSPGSGDPKPRIVSGSLKDRIAKFNNPSAPPPIPGQYGAAGGRSASGGGTMIGNRLPQMDRSGGHVAGGRKIREDRGMIGNRIPSMGTGGVYKTSATGEERAASPTLSVDSSSASGQAASSTSPVTSRSSSPPTSLGDGDTLPSTLLSATLPDDGGGSGTMTPSSTRAEAGEETSSLSIPNTPVQKPIVPALAQAGYEDPSQVVMDRMPSFQSASGRSVFAPSVTASLDSSRASQYDPSSQGSENPQKMMQDVSEISTPTGTPRAAHRDLEGSARGEGSAAGDDPSEIANRLGMLGVDAPDRDQTPEPPNPETKEGNDDYAGPALERDPNTADDLDDLKFGRLSHPKAASGTHSHDQNPINNLAEAGIAQGFAEHNIPRDKLRKQGGVAGQRMEDIEKPDEIEPPKTRSEIFAGGSDINVQSVSSDTGSMSTTADSTNGVNMMSNVIQGERAAGTRLDETGSGPLTSGDTDHLKEALNEDRKKQAEKETMDSTAADPMQTEQDRDEGVDRKAQLVLALDQVKDPDRNLQEGIPEEQEQEAHERTKEMTGADDTTSGSDEVQENENNEQSVKAEEEDGAETPKSSKSAGQLPKEGSTPGHDADESKPGQDEEAARQEVEGMHPGHEDTSRPIQVHVEPISNGPPEETKENADGPGEINLNEVMENESKAPQEASQTLEPSPDFPETPHNDLDTQLETPAQTQPMTDSHPQTPDPSQTPSTPLDTQFLKAFPDVPNEEKPRVEVHVSASPQATPQKSSSSNRPTETPLAKIPGHSKSLSHPDLFKVPELPSPAMNRGESSGGTTADAKRRDSQPEKSGEPGRRDSLGVEGMEGEGKERPGLQKRPSSRRSPKSPLMDDEDPGDFEGGEGWAVIHGMPKWVSLA